MMTQHPGKLVDMEGNEVNHTLCPRCGTINKLVKPERPDLRSVNGVIYERYRTVCRECGLYFKDALIPVEVSE